MRSAARAVLAVGFVTCVLSLAGCEQLPDGLKLPDAGPANEGDVKIAPTSTGLSASPTTSMTSDHYRVVTSAGTSNTTGARSRSARFQLQSGAQVRAQ